MNMTDCPRHCHPPAQFTILNTSNRWIKDPMAKKCLASGENDDCNDTAATSRQNYYLDSSDGFPQSDQPFDNSYSTKLPRLSADPLKRERTGQEIVIIEKFRYLPRRRRACVTGNASSRQFVSMTARAPECCQ
jgi:hypothetical protein